MSAVREILVAAGAPQVRLLDARRAGLDERALRAWARAEADACGARYTSRSYRYPYALVARHPEPVGIDMERIDGFDEQLLASLCTPSERMLPVDPRDPDAYLASLWCSKEALAKALGDAVRYDPRRIGSPMYWRDGSSGPWRAAALTVPNRHTGWLCWRVCS